MKLLVTGTTGYIAGRLVKRLLELNHEVTGVDRRQSLAGTPFPTVKAELDSWEQVKELGEFEAIFHLAGHADGNMSMIRYVDDIRDNVLSTANIVRLAQQSGTRQIMFASSMAIYGDQKVYPVREDALPLPKVYYGANKLAAEYYLKIANTERLHTTSLRLFNVYGPGKDLDDPNQGVVNTFVRALLKDKHFEMRGDPKRFRDFVYVDDVVEAFCLCLNNEKVAGESINVANGSSNTFGELIEMITARLPFKTTVSYTNPSSFDLNGMYGDISKAKALLGFTPKMPFSTGLDLTVEWHKSMVAAQ